MKKSIMDTLKDLEARVPAQGLNDFHLVIKALSKIEELGCKAVAENLGILCSKKIDDFIKKELYYIDEKIQVLYVQINSVLNKLSKAKLSLNEIYETFGSKYHYLNDIFGLYESTVGTCVKSEPMALCAELDLMDAIVEHCSISVNLIEQLHDQDIFDMYHGRFVKCVNIGYMPDVEEGLCILEETLEAYSNTLDKIQKNAHNDEELERVIALYQNTLEYVFQLDDFDEMEDKWDKIDGVFNKYINTQSSGRTFEVLYNDVIQVVGTGNDFLSLVGALREMDGLTILHSASNISRGSI